MSLAVEGKEIEEQIINWRESNTEAYLQLAWICGLVDSDGAETMSADPDATQSHTEAAFAALKNLVEIDPDGRR